MHIQLRTSNESASDKLMRPWDGHVHSHGDGQMGGRAGACDSLRCLSVCLFLTVHLHRWVHFVLCTQRLCWPSCTAANNTSASHYLVLAIVASVKSTKMVLCRCDTTVPTLTLLAIYHSPSSSSPRRPSIECNCTQEIKNQSIGFASSNDFTVSLTRLQRPPAADGRHGTSTGRDGPI
ncbi:uncharacterized protein IWZ02DRAFT_149598 [Phyllosticta citriasiana]|uniref:uncharacterized protein n=1 Tax=Phyllosticta citriasiana TaxID=595635 RepID=UPI0030FDC58D